MSYSNFTLLLNSLFYLFAFTYVKIKKGWGICSFVLLFYFFLSIGSIYLFNESTIWHFEDITVFPLVFLFVTILLFMRPLYSFPIEKTDNIIMPNDFFMKILSWVVICIYLVFFFHTILSSFSLTSLFNPDLLAENYDEKVGNVGVDDGINIFGVLKNMFSDILWLLFMYHCLKGNKLLALGLLLSLVIAIFTALAWGARGPIMRILIDIPFIYFVFRRSMSIRMRKIFLISILAFVSLALIGFVGLTIGRFADDERYTMLEIITYYSSSNFLVFDNYALDANGIRYGDRVFPIFRLLLGLDITGNYIDRRLEYSHMLLDDSQFSFFVGEFMLDYGPYWGFIILMIFSYILYQGIKIKSFQCGFSNLLILSLLYRICVSGFSLFPYSEISGNLSLIYILFFYIFFKISERYNYVKFKIGLSNE